MLLTTLLLILTSSPSFSAVTKPAIPSDGAEPEDGKKTLSQQVAEGKYGLIQRELFSSPTNAAGVLSYRTNSEVPTDDEHNLGGLHKNEIWLAEDHLLVIRGGAFGPHDQATVSPPVWPPIDDYKAPNRPVKIPNKPKVPPPFPVQLQDGGPIRLVGASEASGGPAGPYIPPVGTPTPSPGSPYPAHAAPGRVAIPAAGPLAGNWPPGAAAPPPPSPGHRVPPWAPNNGTGPLTGPPLDEDDPSIYYPPPYSFYYQVDNSTQVPPGPLVPGIVLPPPPNFFSPLEDLKRIKPPTPTYRPTTTSTTTPSPTIAFQPTPLAPPSKHQLPPPLDLPPMPPKRRPVIYYQLQKSKTPTRTYVSTTIVPLRAYFTSTGPKNGGRRPGVTTEFYLYEEEPSGNHLSRPSSVLDQRNHPASFITVNGNGLPQGSIIGKNSGGTKLISIGRPGPIVDHPEINRPGHQGSPVRSGPQSAILGQPESNIVGHLGRPGSIDHSVVDRPGSILNHRGPILDHSGGALLGHSPNPNNIDHLRRPNNINLGSILDSGSLTNSLNRGRSLYKLQTDFDRHVEQLRHKIESYYHYRQPRNRIKPISVTVQRPKPVYQYSFQAAGYEGRNSALSGLSNPEVGSNTFISYPLPGDGAHFYFLTPQATRRRRRRGGGGQSSYRTR